MLNNDHSIGQATFDELVLEGFARKLSADVESGAIAGIDVLIENRSGFAWRRCCGWRDVAARDPLLENAIWRIYSMTKVLVSASTLVLVERGLLRLDQKVADFVPAFADIQVLCPDGTLEPVIVAPTVRDLLCHTAGLGYFLAGHSSAGHYAGPACGLFEDALDNATFCALLAKLPLDYQPRTAWRYSYATDVLGRVLEVAADVCDLQVALDDTMLRPLSMTDTLFRLPCSEARRVANPLPQVLRLGPGPGFEDPTSSRRRQRGSGGLVSTMADYASFLRMMLNKGRHESSTVLSPSSVSLITSAHVEPIANSEYGFGFGVATRMLTPEKKYSAPGDWWWTGFGGTYFLVDPVHDFFTILMMQSASAEQRKYYREQLNNTIYLALMA